MSLHRRIHKVGRGRGQFTLFTVDMQPLLCHIQIDRPCFDGRQRINSSSQNASVIFTLYHIAKKYLFQ